MADFGALLAGASAPLLAGMDQQVATGAASGAVILLKDVGEKARGHYSRLRAAEQARQVQREAVRRRNREPNRDR